MIDRRNDPVLDIDFLKVKLPELVEEFCYTYKIDDMKSESENVFQGMLQYIASSIFDIRHKNKGIFDNRGSILLYNDDALYWVYEWMSLTCRIYNKTCNPFNFSILTGIDSDTIKSWFVTEIVTDGIDISNNTDNNSSGIDSLDNIVSYNNNSGDRVTIKRRKIAKNLYENYEQSLSSLLTSGKNPVGTIAILNHKFGWNNAEVTISAKPKIISASDLPLLSPPE